MCDENYYGNPEVPGGSCRQCNCNNNIDIAKAGNCDSHSGKCLQCLFNTEGENCEVCKTGYYGDAIHQTCTGTVHFIMIRNFIVCTYCKIKNDCILVTIYKCTMLFFL